MAINYPTSLDDGTSLPNPTGTDDIDNANPFLDHDYQHASANTLIKALQAKVGVDASAVTSSLTYKVAALEGNAPLSPFLLIGA